MSRTLETFQKENNELRIELSNAHVEIAKLKQTITSLTIQLETLSKSNPMPLDNGKGLYTL